MTPNKASVAAATPPNKIAGLAFLFSQWYIGAQFRHMVPAGNRPFRDTSQIIGSMVQLIALAGLVLLSLVLPLWASIALSGRTARRTTRAAVWAGQIGIAGAGLQIIAGAAPGPCAASAIAGCLAYGLALNTSLASQDGQQDQADF